VTVAAGAAGSERNAAGRVSAHTSSSALDPAATPSAPIGLPSMMIGRRSGRAKSIEVRTGSAKV
jgi:hypothetical protein